ncbi:antitoxin VapB family protein [Candidatus Woesearchaeota archaeon]|nr:antitoxin VapB family protein [Candidatus Woesearchaeota archaeon]
MTKVISLSNEAYERIKSVKRSGESFSDVIIKLIGKTKKKPLSDFLGKWSG